MIAVLKYNGGNVRSVQNALERLGVESVVTGDPKVIVACEKLIIPGVGEASSALAYFKEHGLDQVILNLKQPVLGICLGLQLLCNSTEEGETKGLGIFKTRVRLFPKSGLVPHMGWNNVSNLKGPLFKGIEEGANLYFTHSFYAESCPAQIAECDYLQPFACALQQNNFYACQFHPEKSGKIGQQILKNFIEL
jgi:glutamine amidotransferase